MVALYKVRLYGPDYTITKNGSESKLISDVGSLLFTFDFCSPTVSDRADGSGEIAKDANHSCSQ